MIEKKFKCLIVGSDTLLEHHCLENKHETMLFSATKMKIYRAYLSN